MERLTAQEAQMHPYFAPVRDSVPGKPEVEEEEER